MPYFDNTISVLHFSDDGGPSLHDSLTTPVVTTEDKSVLITCVVRKLGSHTLIWKYGTHTVLTAGDTRITADPRFSVLHDAGQCLKNIFI